jgi:adenylate kinase family enzyme
VTRSPSGSSTASASSVKDVLTIADDLHARGIGVRILTGKLSGSYSPAGEGKFFFTMMAAFAELERDIIHERTMAGLVAARAQGRSGGRPTVMDENKLTAARARRALADCGMDHNLIANSPKVPGRCDMRGGELITREDDTEEALAVRLRANHDQTNPVLAIFRRKECVYTVDARPAPEVIQQQIRECLGLPPYQPENRASEVA